MPPLVYGWSPPNNTPAVIRRWKLQLLLRRVQLCSTRACASASPRSTLSVVISPAVIVVPSALITMSR